MSDLVSKVLAGGLSAGIFLAWWPAHVPGDGPEWLAVRGLLWSLAFEILLFAFCPLERAIARSVRERDSAGFAPRPFARALVLATAGLAIPAALFGATGDKLEAPVQTAAAAPSKVIVKREIVRREVVVRRVNHVVPVPVAQARAATRTTGAAAAPAPARAPRATTAVASKPTVTRTAAKNRAPVVATAPKREASTAPKATPAPAAQPAATAPAATTPAATSPSAGATSAPATGHPAGAG